MLTFHLAIALLMALTSFALVMAAYDLLFVDARVESLRQRAHSLWSDAAVWWRARMREEGRGAEPA